MGARLLGVDQLNLTLNLGEGVLGLIPSMITEVEIKMQQIFDDAYDLDPTSLDSYKEYYKLWNEYRELWDYKDALQDYKDAWDDYEKEMEEFSQDNSILRT